MSLVLRFRQTHDVSEKERILYRIIPKGHEAGQLLLDLAKTTDDNDTRWLAIRGLGIIKFEDAAPFLIESLKSQEHYVRANAARALAELPQKATTLQPVRDSATRFGGVAPLASPD